MKKIIMIAILCLGFLAGIAQQPAVDVITLKNGSVIRGKILEQNTLLIKIYTTNRSMVEVKPDEVESMTKEAGGPADQIATTFDEDSFKEDNIIIGGSGTIDFMKQKYYEDGVLDSEYSRTGFTINPSFAYFIMDGLAVGAILPLSLYSSKGDITYSLGIGPVVKYYTDFLAVFKLEAAYEFSHAPSWKGGSFYLKPGVGMAFFLNPKVSLEPGLFYQLNSDNRNYEFYKTKLKTSKLGIEIGLTIFL